MRKNIGRQRGFSLMELLVVIGIILVILTMAIPFYYRQIMLSHETAAIRAVGTIQVAEAQFATEHGQYAGSLAELGPGEGELIPEDLAAGKNNGYLFEVAAQGGGFTIRARPEVFGRTGKSSFYSDETLVIRRNSSAEMATAGSPQIK